MHPVKVHPKMGTTIILWGDDRNVSHELIKGRNCEGSLVFFDKRQIWEVYPYKRDHRDTEYHGACERKGVYVRLGPSDFKRIFGEEAIELAKDDADRTHQQDVRKEESV